jgi:hypothetical protein
VNARQHAALVSALQLSLPSFPCRGDKAPYPRSRGFKDAVAPSLALMSLWNRFPGELIGIPTGRLTGIAVLDIDRKGGAEWYEENKSRLPDTRIHRTGSGGLHLVYRHKAGLKCSASKIAPGIDVRAEGGYFIWWPTEGLEVREEPLAEWPDWLEWLIVEPEERAPRAKVGVKDPFALAACGLDAKLRGIINRVERAMEGERNAITFWAACRAAELVAEGHLEDRWARDVIVCAAQNVGLPAFEAERTIQSAFRRVAQ